MAWSLWLEIAEAASIDSDEGGIVSGRVAEVIDKIDILPILASLAASAICISLPDFCALTMDLSLNVHPNNTWWKTPDFVGSGGRHLGNPMA